MSAVPHKDATHSWSVANFETFRAPLVSFLKERILPVLDAAECRRILIRAPVKSGKREMVEYLAVRDLAHNPSRVHAFVSAFHRVADEEQRKELKIHNLEIFSLRTKQPATKCCDWITAQLRAGKEVVVHIDECDFGAGERQILSKVYEHVRTTPMITTILYSATPQEVLFSGEVEEEEYQTMVDDHFNEGVWIEYTPPASFCGPARFLDDGLFEDAKPFFYKEADGIVLSDQGKSILGDLRAAVTSRSGRNLLVLRLSYSDLGGTRSDRKENKAIYQFLHNWQSIPELAGCLIIADKSEKDIPSSSHVLKEKIGWSEPRYWLSKTKEVPIIMVIDQTSSRSTEWACHDRVLAYHDFRNTVVFSTISQAQERVNHYEGKYAGGFQRIKVFGHLKTALLSAGRITYASYLHYDWKSHKIDVRTATAMGLTEPMYRIQSTTNSRVFHPSYPVPLTKTQADRALQNLGCFAELKVSQRVRGFIGEAFDYYTEFFSCTPETWTTVKPCLEAHLPGRNFQNPFQGCPIDPVSGKYQGYMWKYSVLDYDSQVKGKGTAAKIIPRLTICYCGTELGVALRYNTGTKKEINTLKAFRSMYGN